MKHASLEINALQMNLVATVPNQGTEEIERWTSFHVSRLLSLFP